MIRPHTALAAALLLTIGLSACHKTPQRPQGAGNVSGEILPGSASDAMLPLDTLRSQPPLAGPGKGAGSGAGDAADEGDAAPARGHQPNAAPGAAASAEPAPPAAPVVAPIAGTDRREVGPDGQ